MQRTSYSHVRLAWDSVVYEASGTSVKFLGPMALDSRPVEVIKEYELDLTHEQFHSMLDACMKYAGVSYGIRQLFEIAWQLIGRRPGPGDGAASMVCSELVGRVLSNLEYDMGEVDFDRLTPKELEKWCFTNLILGE